MPYHVSFKEMRADLEEALRVHGLAGSSQIGQVKSVTLEPNGEITTIKKGEGEEQPFIGE